MDSLYSERNVLVDRNFARFGTKSYAIDKINSVDICAKRTDSDAGSVVFMIVGSISLIAVFSSIELTGRFIFFDRSRWLYFSFSKPFEATKKVHVQPYPHDIERGVPSLSIAQ